MVSSKLKRPYLPAGYLDDLVAAALREDLGGELGDTDITTNFVVDAALMAEAAVIAKKAGAMSGGDAAARVFQKVDPAVEYSVLKTDGERIEAGEEAARGVGPLASILPPEPTALNFLQPPSRIPPPPRPH